MSSGNTALFLSLNAAEMPDALHQALAEALAIAPVLLAPALLTCLWVWGRPDRRGALIAAGGGTFVGQGINLLLGLAWFEPRPFMAGIGHTWLGHVADNGFPSDHATLAWSLGLGLVLTGGSRRWGTAACLVGLAAGWARVYLGVHFPVDVLASIPAGLLAASLATAALPLVRRRVARPVERFYEAAIERLPPWVPVPRGTAP
jgi:undecaprenyl-diphosphatase